MSKLKVLSLFDGIGGGRQALKELNIDCDYFAIEIDRFAYEIAISNHSDIYHLSNSYVSDVRDFLHEDFEK
jgi:site-specific DNA-cytosine methylase